MHTEYLHTEQTFALHPNRKLFSDGGICPDGESWVVPTDRGVPARLGESGWDPSQKARVSHAERWQTDGGFRRLYHPPPAPQGVIMSKHNGKNNGRVYMPTLLETAHKEWAACHDKLLDIYVRETAETEFSDWFKVDVKRLSDIDLEAQRPLDHDLDGILREIKFFHIIIEHAYLLIWEIIRPDTIHDVEYLARERPNDPGERPYPDTDDLDFDDDEYDPYCEDVYHEDDPRLYEGKNVSIHL